MSDDPKHPYRTPWDAAKMVVTPAQMSTPWVLRRELIELRARADRMQLDHSTIPTGETLVATIAQLTEARTWVRSWSRPARSALLVLAGAMVGPVTYAVLRQPGGAGAAALSVTIACIAGLVAELWANAWLDLVVEYDGLIADLRKLLDKAPKGQVGERELHDQTGRMLLRMGYSVIIKVPDPGQPYQRPEFRIESGPLDKVRVQVATADVEDDTSARADPEKEER